MKEKTKELSPSPALIRTIISKTGWIPYEAYCHMWEIKKQKEVFFKEINSQSLWKEYKVNEAQLLLGGEKEEFTPKYSNKKFNALFYTDKQKKALKDIKNKIITLETVCNFVDADVPEEIIGQSSDDVRRLLAFRPSQIVQNSVFFCISKDYADVQKCIEKKPALIICAPSHEELLKDAGVPIICVKGVISYVLDLARNWRNAFDIAVVGISGSVGKTSTTEMIGKVVGQSKNMFKIEGNQNTTWQISKFIFSLKDDHDVYVQECSGSFLSQLEKSTFQLNSDYFVITNIGNGHIGNYDGKKELLLYEKMALDRHAKPGAIGIINGDDELLSKAKFIHKTVSYSMKDPNADYYAEDIVEKDGDIRFNIVEKDSTKTAVVIHVCGVHNVYNALSAFALGVMLGIDRQRIVESIATYRTNGIRQNLVHIAGRKVYLDYYNASDKSIKSALNTMQTISVPDGNKKIAVFGDVLALGDQNEIIHRQIGKMIAEINTVDDILFYGHDMGYAKEEASKLGVACSHTEDRDSAIKWIKANTKPGDLICFKASHGMALHYIVDALYGTATYFDDEISEGLNIGDTGEYRYAISENYGLAIKNADKTIKKVSVVGSIDGLKMLVIHTGAFSNSKIKEIDVPENVECISSKAFYHCQKLKRASLPKSLRYIGVEAFADCDKLKSVVINDGVLTIDENAFSNCKKLRKITIPSSVLSINHPFEASKKIKIYCEKNSVADKWARENGYNVKNI